MEGNKTLTKKDLRKSWFTWFTYHTACWNWERMQNVAFCLCMEPILKKVCKNKEDYKKGLVRHTRFFNSEPQSSTIIHGMVASLEEQRAAGADITEDAIDAIKAGMMGPLAGIGDSMVAALLNTILLSIGISMAISGNLLGPVFFLATYVPIVTFGSWWLYKKGYELGASSINKIVGEGGLHKFTEAMSVLGLVVIGGLTASFVNVKTKLEFAGEATINIQKLLDGIMPGLLPLGLTFLVYYLINKKGISVTATMGLIFIFGMLLSILGIL